MVLSHDSGRTPEPPVCATGGETRLCSIEAGLIWLGTVLSARLQLWLAPGPKSGLSRTPWNRPLGTGRQGVSRAALLTSTDVPHRHNITTESTPLGPARWKAVVMLESQTASLPASNLVCPALRCAHCEQVSAGVRGLNPSTSATRPTRRSGGRAYTFWSLSENRTRAGASPLPPPGGVFYGHERLLDPGGAPSQVLQQGRVVRVGAGEDEVAQLLWTAEVRGSDASWEHDCSNPSCGLACHPDDTLRTCAECRRGATVMFETHSQLDSEPGLRTQVTGNSGESSHTPTLMVCASQVGQPARRDTDTAAGRPLCCNQSRMVPHTGRSQARVCTRVS